MTKQERFSKKKLWQIKQKYTKIWCYGINKAINCMGNWAKNSINFSRKRFHWVSTTSVRRTNDHVLRFSFFRNNVQQIFVQLQFVTWRTSFDLKYAWRHWPDFFVFKISGDVVKVDCYVDYLMQLKRRLIGAY